MTIDNSLKKNIINLSVLFSFFLCVVGVFKNQDILTPSWAPEKSFSNLKAFSVYYFLFSTFLTLFFRKYLIKISSLGLTFFLIYALGFSSFFAPFSVFFSSFIIGVALFRLFDIEFSLPLLPIAILLGLSTFYFVIYAVNFTSYNNTQGYALLLSIPVLLFWRIALVACEKLKKEFSLVLSYSRYELVCCFLVLFGFILHFQNVLRPEFDFDALAAHLMIPHHVKAQGRWSFDYNQFVFGVNQLGADFLYAFVYVLSDEVGVRFFNLLILSLLSSLIFFISSAFSTRKIALLISVIVFSCPLFVTQTSTLHVEGVWTSFLVGIFYLSYLYTKRDNDGQNFLPLIGVLSGMALAVKMPSLFYLPFFASYLIFSDFMLRKEKSISYRQYLIALILFFLVGCIPYLYCYYITGNPVFPYFNGVFKSPYFYKSSDFNNPIFNKPLTFRTFYDMTFHGQWYLESLSYPLSLYFLFFFVPVVFFLLFQLKNFRLIILASLVFVSGAAIYLFQSYLRYLLPSFFFMLILVACFMQFLESSSKRIYYLCTASIFLILPFSFLRFPDAAHSYREFNWSRSLSKYVKEDYIFQRPLQVLYDYLNVKYKTNSSVLLMGTPLSAGLDGTVLVNAWYNPTIADFISKATTKKDFENIISEYGVTHIIFDGVSFPNQGFRDFIIDNTELELDHYPISLYKINYKNFSQGNLLKNIPLEHGYVATVDIKDIKKYIFEIELLSLESKVSNWSLVFNWKDKKGAFLDKSEHIYNTVDQKPYLFSYLLNVPDDAEKLVISIPNTQKETVKINYYGLIKIAEPGSLPSYQGSY